MILLFQNNVIQSISFSVVSVLSAFDGYKMPAYDNVECTDPSTVQSQKMFFSHDCKKSFHKYKT